MCPKSGCAGSCSDAGRDGGSDPTLDEAIRLHDAMAGFLQQDMFMSASLGESVREMAAAVGMETPSV